MRILARTLRRTFLLRGPLPDDCFAFLQADPLLPAPTERTELIAIAPRDDDLLSLRCSWGYRAIGSARALTRSLDKAIHQLAAADEGSTLGLHASALRLDGTRILVAAEFDVDLAELTIALLVKGAAFEGTGLAFFRAGGIVAHPAKPHLRRHRLAAAGLSPMHGPHPTLHLNCEEALCAIDPGLAGAEWSVTEGPAPLLLFVERNDGGRSAIAPLRFDKALPRLMRSVRSAGRPDMRAFARFRATIEGMRLLRVSMGDPVAAAALMVAQVPQARVDGCGRVGHRRHPDHGDDTCSPMRP